MEDNCNEGNGELEGLDYSSEDLNGEKVYKESHGTEKDQTFKITRTDIKWFKGKFFNYRDDGLVKRVDGAKATTHTYSVFDKKSGTLVGNVKWYNRWVQYSFYPLASTFSYRHLRDISLFCEVATTTYMERNADEKKRKAAWKKEKARRKKYWV